MTSASIESTLQLLSFLFSGILVGRLIQASLFRAYPIFSLLAFVSLCLDGAAALLRTSSMTYLHVYLGLEPVRILLFILMVWELFSVIFRNYVGLRSLSRWVMGIAAAVASVGFILTLIGARGSGAFIASPRVRTVLTFERGVTFGLVIFILIMLYFISRYPIQLPRNTIVLCIVYSIWFLGMAAILVITSFVGKAHRFAVNDVWDLLQIGSYAGWAFLLSKSGGYQETRVRRDISPEQEAMLIAELNAMNNVLLRAGRSISHSRSAGD